MFVASELSFARPFGLAQGKLAEGDSSH